MAKLRNSKKRKIYRPEITIEYQSITQIPLILLAVFKFGIKLINCNLTTDKYTIGVIKMLIIPKYRFIRR